MINDITKTSLLSREDLLATIGESVITDRLYAFSFKNEKDKAKKMVELGKDWFEDNLIEMHKLVCASYFIKAYMNSERIQNRMLIMAAIADLISPIFFDKPVLSLAALIVDEGLETICQP